MNLQSIDRRIGKKWPGSSLSVESVCRPFWSRSGNWANMGQMVVHTLCIDPGSFDRRGKFQ